MPTQWHTHQFPLQDFWVGSKNAIISQTNAALKNFTLIKSYRKDGVFTIHTEHYIHHPRILELTFVGYEGGRKED